MVSDWYNEKYKELTGTAPVLGDAAPEKLLQYAIAMLGGQTLQYIQDKGNGELLATSYGDYLDQLAANLGVTRKPADRATVTLRFTLADTRNNAVGIPAGTRVRTENSLYFNTLDYAEVKAGELTADVLAQAQEAGAESNGIETGAINTLVDPIPYMERVTNIEASHGGTDTEDDDALSERVFLAPSVFSCAGPADANAEVPPQRTAGEAQYQPFWLREKTKEMLHYGYKLTMTFPRKSKELADEMRRTMISMYRMTVELDKKCYKKTTTQTLDVELAWLRELVVMASDKDFYGDKMQPPLTMHQREVWAKMNDEIGRLLGGYLKTLKQ